MTEKIDSKSVNLKNVKIIGVSSPTTINLIAQDKGLDPKEVFVRVTFEYEGKQYTVSNKLKFLKQIGYTKLLECKEKQIPCNITITDTGFLYLDDGTTVEDLFKSKNTEENKKAYTDQLNALFNTIL